MQTIQNFLRCATPSEWLIIALQNQSLLLIDHAHCEKKAASAAISLIHQYADKPELLTKMSRLAREELRHFEKVLQILTRRNIGFTRLEPCSYAQGLRRYVSHYEPQRLVDILIIGAFIEARSCERFGVIAPYLDAELGNFYRELHQAESRHFHDYLQLAQQFAEQDITARITEFAEIEAQLILGKDNVLRFHSGILAVDKHKEI